MRRAYKLRPVHRTSPFYHDIALRCGNGQKTLPDGVVYASIQERLGKFSASVRVLLFAATRWGSGGKDAGTGMDAAVSELLTRTHLCALPKASVPRHAAFLSQ